MDAFYFRAVNSSFVGCLKKGEGRRGDEQISGDGGRAKRPRSSFLPATRFNLPHLHAHRRHQHHRRQQLRKRGLH